MIQLILTYRYLILFPLALVEGPILALIIGFLIKVGYFDFFPAYAVMVAGDFIPDSLYYYLGKLGYKGGRLENFAKKLTEKARFIFDHIGVIEKLWKEHPGKMMFLSKLAYGLSTPLLMSAGLVNMGYRRFIAYAFPITLLQYAIFLGAGYYLGLSYAVAEKYIKYGGYTAAILVVILICAYISIQKYAREKFMEMENGENNRNDAEIEK